MNAKEAIKKAENSDAVRKIMSEGFALSSCVGISKLPFIPSEWILSYYNPESNEVVACSVNEGSVELSKGSEAIKSPSGFIDSSKLGFWEEELFEKAFAEIPAKRFNQLIATLSIEEDTHIWAFNFISDTLAVLTVKASAETGLILSKKERSLLHSSQL